MRTNRHMAQEIWGKITILRVKIVQAFVEVADTMIEGIGNWFESRYFLSCPQFRPLGAAGILSVIDGDARGLADAI